MPDGVWETCWEWIRGLLLAVPLIALIITVDQHPSWWGVLGLRLLMGLITVIPSVAVAAIDWDDDTEPELEGDPCRDLASPPLVEVVA